MKNFSKILIFMFMFSLVAAFSFAQADTRLKEGQDWLEKAKVDASLKFKGNLCESEYGVNVKPNPYSRELYIGNWKKVKDNVDCSINNGKLRLMDLPANAVPKSMTDVVFWLVRQREYRKDIYVIRPFKIVTKYKKVPYDKEIKGEFVTVVDEKKSTEIMKPIPGKEIWKIVRVKNDLPLQGKRQYNWRYMIKRK